MQLSVEAFQKQISQGALSASYVLVSDAPFLLEEIRRYIWRVSSIQRFFDRKMWEIHQETDWNDIIKHTIHCDLFDKSLLDLRCRQLLDAKTGSQLEALIKRTLQSSERVPIISCEQPIKSLQKHNWFQKIASISTLVVLEVPTYAQLPQWITTRLRQVGLSLTNEAITALIECTKGNLPAIIQLVKKLRLLYTANQSPLQLAQLRIVLEDQTMFELFHLTESILQGDSSRCLRIIHYLRATPASQALVLGYLMRLLRTAAKLLHELDKGHALSDLFRKHSVWKSQQAGFKKLIDHMRVLHLPALFKLAYQADRCAKGMDPKMGWHYLSQMSVLLSGQTEKTVMLALG